MTSLDKKKQLEKKQENRGREKLQKEEQKKRYLLEKESNLKDAKILPRKLTVRFY